MSTCEQTHSGIFNQATFLLIRLELQTLVMTTLWGVGNTLLYRYWPKTDFNIKITATTIHYVNFSLLYILHTVNIVI